MECPEQDMVQGSGFSCTWEKSINSNYQSPYRYSNNDLVQLNSVLKELEASE